MMVEDMVSKATHDENGGSDSKDSEAKVTTRKQQSTDSVTFF